MCIKCWKGVLCVCCIRTLFLEHVVRFQNLGFFFKPQRPAVEDLRHSVFHFLWSPGAEVLHRKHQHRQSRQGQSSESNFGCTLQLSNYMVVIHNNNLSG